MKHDPHAMLNGITTRSPGFRSVTSAPTSSTTPIGSWPRMLPSLMNAPSTSYRCRSDPQMPLEVTRTIASVGSSIAGSGTLSTRTSRFPCQVRAFIALLRLRVRRLLPWAGLLNASVEAALHLRSSSPRRPFEAARLSRLPLREGGVRLVRARRLDLHADAVLQRDLVADVHDFLRDARAAHEDHARALAGADEPVLGVRRAVDEVPSLQVPLLALDHEDALAREHEKVLLVPLAVIAAARLAGLEDGDRVPDLRERDCVTLDDARRAEDVVVDPGRVAHVDDEPAVGGGGQAVLGLLEPRLVQVTGSTCRRSSCRGRCSWRAGRGHRRASRPSRRASDARRSSCRSVPSCGRSGSCLCPSPG